MCAAGRRLGDVTMFGKLLKWFRIPVANVPEEIAVCEFDCNKTECLLGDWEQCERRRNVQAGQQRNLDNRAR